MSIRQSTTAAIAATASIVTSTATAVEATASCVAITAKLGQKYLSNTLDDMDACRPIAQEAKIHCVKNDCLDIMEESDFRLQQNRAKRVILA